MSTLHTLHDAFAEFERRADDAPWPDQLSWSGERSAQRGDQLPVRRRLMPMAVAVAVIALLIGGVSVGAVLWRDGHQNTAATPSSGEVMLWRGEGVPCPYGETGDLVTSGAFLPYGGGCVELEHRLGAFASPIDAHVVPQGGGGWMVTVALSDSQAHFYSKAVEAASGHLLAIVAGGEVLSAPRVEQSVTGSTLQIAAPSEQAAQHIALLLTTP